MTEQDAPTPRVGSTADLSRRMDRMEAAHDALGREVASLSDTIQRVELNQQHAYELNDLRFKSLDTAVGAIGTKLDSFMARMEGIITGEVQTAQAKNGERLVS